MKNNSNKGQITVFIILGLVLLVGAIFFLSVREPVEEPFEVIKVPALLQPVYVHVEDCIKDIAVPGLYLLAIQGGYIYLPDEYLATDYSNVGYGYSNGYAVMPKIDEMESQLEQYIADMVPSCVNFELFPDLDITSENITSEVTITTKEVIFKISYPITGRKEESISEVEKFRVIIPIRLGYIYDSMVGILTKTMDDPDWIDMTYLSGFDVKVDIVPHDETTFIYSLTDNKPADPYIFLSAFRFKSNLAPVINVNDTIYPQDGVPFLMEVEVTDPEGDSFTCSDNTALFDITDDCTILFTPEIPGDYEVIITAVDIRGNVGDKEIKIVVVE
ncbi:hypothetical protein KY360_07525 [Candidatus Woesearchaeota archaeon]|nr:hypothetical protein [Candidatus Woesearchaeota archaeon]